MPISITKEALGQVVEHLCAAGQIIAQATPTTVDDTVMNFLHTVHTSPAFDWFLDLVLARLNRPDVFTEVPMPGELVAEGIDWEVVRLAVEWIVKILELFLKTQG